MSNKMGDISYNDSPSHNFESEKANLYPTRKDKDDWKKEKFHNLLLIERKDEFIFHL